MHGEGYECDLKTLTTLSSLNHPLIMCGKGFKKIKDSLSIFVEFCPNGSLTDLLTEGILEGRVSELFWQMIEGKTFMNTRRGHESFPGNTYD